MSWTAFASLTGGASAQAVCEEQESGSIDLARGRFMQVLCINEEVARLRSGARISEKCLDLQQQRAKRQAGADDAATLGSSKAKVTAVRPCSLQGLHMFVSPLMP
jgi:hypothetical protein